MVVVDADRSAESRELDHPLRRVGQLHHRRRASARPTRSIAGSSTGRAWMALSIPPDYGAAGRASGETATLQVVADGTDSNSTNVALGYARVLIAGYARGSAGRARRRPSAGAGRSRPAIRVWFNPDLESRDFMIPGHRRAAAAGRHDQPLGDGDRARKGARHARAAERHAAGALGADRRQAPAVRAHRHDRRRARAGRRDLWFEVPMRGSLAAALRDEPRLPADDARSRPVRLDHLRRPSSRR